jgi:hypothetical protein
MSSGDFSKKNKGHLDHLLEALRAWKWRMNMDMSNQGNPDLWHNPDLPTMNLPNQLRY